MAQEKLHCAFGAPGDCLRVARIYTAMTPSDLKQAKPYLQLAVGMYARECRARDPVACQALSHLYASGEGVRADSKQERALRDRARELCRIQPRAVCAKLELPGEATP